jgi:hypothetical protein
MLEDQAFRVMLVELACWEPEFKLDHPFQFVLSNIFHQIKPCMKIVGYERMFLVFDQCGVISLQDGLIIDFSHNKLVWDMSG